MGIPISSVYGGGGPLGSPVPSPLQEDGDFTKEAVIGPAGIVVAAIIFLIIIRALYEMAD